MIKKIVIAAFAAIIAVAAQVASGAPEPEVKYTFDDPTVTGWPQNEGTAGTKFNYAGSYSSKGKNGGATFAALTKGCGVHSFSPWWNGSGSVGQNYTIALTLKATTEANNILLCLGFLQQSGEVLLFTTGTANSVKLVVVKETTVQREMSLPVEDVTKFHAYVFRGANGKVTANVDGQAIAGSIDFTLGSDALQLLGGYNKQDTMTDFVHGCGQVNSSSWLVTQPNKQNVVADFRLWTTSCLSDADVSAYATSMAGTEVEQRVNLGYSFFTAGDGANFYAWTNEASSGMKSGGAGVGNVNSWVDVVVQGPATVTFDWEASSESSWDKLHFYDNGGEKLSAISGTTRESQSYSITDSNAHVLKFAYTKDGSVNKNSDCGWVRNFKVTRSSDLVPADYIQYAELCTAGGAAINSGYSYAADTRIDIAWKLDASSSLGGLTLASGESTLTCKGANAYFSDGAASQVLAIGGTATGDNCPLFIFDRAGGLTPSASDKIVGGISSFRIIDSAGVVQRNMIPCKRLSDGVAGFYDTVGGGFYPSVTETPFTAVTRVSGYAITLDAQGGAGGSTFVKVPKLGGAMPAVEPPAKSGFDFLGYYTENGTQYYDSNGQGVKAWDVDDDATLTARWDSTDNTSVMLPAAVANHTYAVVNETAGTTVEKVALTSDGRQVYRIPPGAKVSITCVPSDGCFVQGENPYVIDAVTAGMTVDAADLPRGATQTLIALENVFDTANTPTTVELVYDEGGTLVGHRVTLGQDYGPLTLAKDLGAVTIDLNGWTIRGTAGMNGAQAAGSDGVPAITVAGTGPAAGTTAITLVNETTEAALRPVSGTAAAVVGGKGGNGEPIGHGASAIADADGAAYANVIDSLGLAKKGENGLVGGVVYDPTSTYVPTRIVNGTFDEEPFMEYDQNGEHRTRENAINDGYPTAVYPNGPDGGWNTTETQKYGPSFFEWTDAYGTYGVPQAATHGFFIEMNAHNNAVLSQDLVTYGGDVIRWSLRHGYRSTGGLQSIRVEIGAPNGPATGIGSDVNSNIKAETKASYTASGVTNPEGVTYGYDGSLAGLEISSMPCDWHDVFGIYQIPEGQDVTRFAFIAVSPTYGTGNLLDDLTFSTIIGNLKSVANDDGTVTITGYWGDENETKRLRMEIDDEIYDLDMSNIHSQNFTVTIPRELIGEATSFVAYHQDYPNAKRIVVVQHPNQFKVVADGTAFKAWCTNETHSAEMGCQHHGEENAVVLQLEVAPSVAYTGALYDGVTLAGGSEAWEQTGLPVPTLTYAVQGQTNFSETAPSCVGSYTVKAQVGEASVTFDFEITKPENAIQIGDVWVVLDGEGGAMFGGNGELDPEEIWGENSPIADKGKTLTHVSVEDGITSIGPRFFQDFWNLGDMTIGSNVASIGDFAFQRCYGLTNVVCEATSVTVGTGAFIRCNSLETMSFASNPTWGEMSFKIQAAIRMNNGAPEVYAIPAITIGGLSQRVMGKKKLADKSWTDVTDLAPEAKKAYHFFKIEMKSMR